MAGPLNEILNSIKVHLGQRASSPLFGAFLISWVGWNYRFLIALFSSLSPEDKFALIDKYFYQSNLGVWEKGILFPLATAVLFLVIYPWVALLIYKLTKKGEIAYKVEKKNTEDTMPLTREEEKKLRRDMIELAAAHENEANTFRTRISTLEREKKSIEDAGAKLVADKNIEISNLNEQIRSYREVVRSHEEKIRAISDGDSGVEQNTTEQIVASKELEKLMFAIAENGNIAFVNDLKGLLSLGQAKIDLLLHRGRTVDFIQDAGATAGGSRVRLTGRGLEYLERNGLLK